VALTGDKTESDERDGDDVSMIDGVTKDSTADVAALKPMGGLIVVVSRSVWLVNGIEDMVGASIAEVGLIAVGRASVADASVKMVKGVELITTEEDNPSTLDMISRDVGVGGNVDVSVGKLATGSNEASMVAEDDMALPTSLARLDGISVGVVSKDPGTIIDSDATVASGDVSRGVLISSEAIGVVSAEGRGLVTVGRSSSLELDDIMTGNSEDEA
jgi:hypothetical protein